MLLFQSIWSFITEDWWNWLPFSKDHEHDVRTRAADCFYLHFSNHPDQFQWFGVTCVSNLHLFSTNMKITYKSITNMIQTCISSPASKCFARDQNAKKKLFLVVPGRKGAQGRYGTVRSLWKEFKIYLRQHIFWLNGSLFIHVVTPLSVCWPRVADDRSCKRKCSKENCHSTCSKTRRISQTRTPTAQANQNCLCLFSSIHG